MPNSNTHDESDGYGLIFGFIYIFNLIVGSGALTMPKAFNDTGIILSSVLLVVLSMISFITATFMFEAMSIANAIKNFQKLDDNNEQTEEPAVTATQSKETNFSEFQQGNNQNPDQATTEESPLILGDQAESSNYRRVINDSPEDNFNNYNVDTTSDTVSIYYDRKIIDKKFAIKNKFEMSEMAEIFFNKIGKFFFYVVMILYLYGDLAIYNAAVPKSLRDTTCNYIPEFENETLTEKDPCWTFLPKINRFNAYRIFVLLFNCTIGIMVFYNLQKTKMLQMLTTIMRWIAFISMITLSIRIIIKNQTSINPNPISPKYFNIAGIPNFFGVCIYAYMCHHSLPSIITPMKNKEKYKLVFLVTYLSILVFYLLLSYTGVFAFGDHLNEFYTLNFLPDSRHPSKNLFEYIIDYYLSLFPVFTISASFPIIGITLRNNLKSLYYFITKKQQETPSYFVSLGLPLITLIPPLIIALITHDLQLLVGITGSYAGVAIQYIIPSCLVYLGRREAVRVFRQDFSNKHSYSSPFKNRYWVFFVLIWSNLTILFVTINHILTRK